MKSFKKIILLSIFIFTIFSIFTVCNAASASMSASNTEVDVGESVTISISVNAASWELHVSGAVTGDFSDVTDDGTNTSFTKTLSFTPSSAGTYTVNLNGNYTDGDSNQTSPISGQSVTITAVDSSSNSEPEPTQETPTQQEQTPVETAIEEEPNFTDVSKTVYSNTDVNLRASWSTDSQATRIPKDTELLLTGTSTKTVNGYVWYRVTYNGQLKYIASQYITETKPQNSINLKTIDIEGVELKPAFSNDVTEYTGTIKNFTEKEIKVTATAEDSKTTVKVDGNKNLKFGENTITVTVKAEDGTEKKFTIKLTNEQVEAFGLKTLKINDKVIKGFSVDKFEYNIDFLDLDKLDIKAEPNTEGAKVEITGNEKLKEGKNIITIVVKSSDGNTTVTYKITANKTITAESSNELDIKYIAIAAIVAVATLIIIIILIIKYAKDRKVPIIDYDYKEELDEEDGYLVGKSKKNDYEENSRKKYKYDADEDEIDEDDDYNDDDDDGYDEEDDDYNNDDGDDDDDSSYDDEEDEDDEEEEEIEFLGSRKSRRKTKFTVDDLYDENYEVEELPKRKGKGKHSK